MEIHKPKPWHGLREFLKEYLIIVVGVLTALAAEQSVEWLHWRGEIAAARAELRPEYVRLMEWVGHQDGEAACVGRRLDQLQAIVDQAAQTRRLPPLGPPGQPTRDPWRLRAWDALVSGQVIAHLGREETIAVTGVATGVDYLIRIRDDEMIQWATLQTLMGPGREIDAAELSTYRRTLGQAERDGSIMRISADAVAKSLMASGFVGAREADAAWRKGVAYSQRWIICKPIPSAARQWSQLDPGLTAPLVRPY